MASLSFPKRRGESGGGKRTSRSFASLLGLDAQQEGTCTRKKKVIHTRTKSEKHLTGGRKGS